MFVPAQYEGHCLVFASVAAVLSVRGRARDPTMKRREKSWNVRKNCIFASSERVEKATLQGNLSEQEHAEEPVYLYILARLEN